MGPEFLTEIEARTALETPQIVLTWTFDDELTTPMSSLRWLWDTMIIRRSEFRFPEDPTDGDSVLSEPYSDDAPVSFADINIDALEEYYYSLFLQYTEHDSSQENISQDIKRLGSQITSVYYDPAESKMSRSDGSTTATGDTFSTAAGTFLTDGIVAGDILFINNGGSDDGYYRITSVDSETQVTINGVSWNNTATSIVFEVLDGHTKFWIAGIDFKRKPTIWRWDSVTQMVDYKIDLSDILSLDEFVQSIAYAGFISGASGWVSKHLGKPSNATIPTAGDTYTPGNPGGDFQFNPDGIDRDWTNATPNVAVAYELMSAIGVNPATDIIKIWGGCIANPAVIGDPALVQGGGIAIYGPGRDDAYLSKGEPIYDFFTDPITLRATSIENSVVNTWTWLGTGSVGLAGEGRIFWNPTGSPFTIPDAGYGSHVVPANSVSLWGYDGNLGLHHLQDRAIDPGVIPDRIGVYPVALNWGAWVGMLGFDGGLAVETWQAGVPGTTKYIAFSTPSRYIRIPIMESPTDADIAVEFDYDGAMDAGFQITGSARDSALAGTVYALDGVSKKVKVITEATGVTSSTVNLAGLDGIDAGDVIGLATDLTNLFIGCKNYIYRIPIGITAPDTDDVDRFVRTVNLLDADIGMYTDLLSSGDYLVVVNNKVDRIITYELEVGREAIWQQVNVADDKSIALYHLDEDTGDPVDSTSHGYDGTNVGMTQEPDGGRFGGAFHAAGATDYIRIDTINSAFNGAEGMISLWFKSDDYTTLSGTLIRIYVNASNYVEILFTGGNLEFRYNAGGTLKTVSATSPVTDNEFHQYIITWSATADEVNAFFDGALFGVQQTSLGTWAGTPTASTIGSSTASAIGSYDEVHISEAVRPVRDRVQLYTDANKMWAYSGRDYEASYEDDDPLGFHYRDEYFTEKFMGGEFLIRNDYDKQQLYPPNKVIEDSEIIFRGPTPLPTLGHTGRLSRLLGLMIDRVADSREAMLDYINRYKTDLESMPSQTNFLGIPGADFENWNVDMLRRYIRLMPVIEKRGGRSISYTEYAYLLGFIPVSDHLQARRRWDSVHYNANYDSRVQAIPLDTMGSCDTGDEYFPLALLRWRFYKRSVKSTGVTSVAANRLLTDTAANFRDTAEIGAMVKVNDKDDNRDNGEYYVTEIHSDTVLKINQDWPQGSLSNLSYTVNWEVPYPDPYIDYLLERFRDLAPQCMKTMHRDGSL